MIIGWRSYVIERVAAWYAYQAPILSISIIFSEINEYDFPGYLLLCYTLWDTHMKRHFYIIKYLLFCPDIVT